MSAADGALGDVYSKDSSEEVGPGQAVPALSGGGLLAHRNPLPRPLLSGPVRFAGGHLALDRGRRDRRTVVDSNSTMKRERSCCECGRRSVLDGVLPERLKTTILDDGVMRGTQIDAMWDLSMESFQPGLDAHTPGVTGLQSRKIVFRVRGYQVVAVHLKEFEKTQGSARHRLCAARHQPDRSGRLRPGRTRSSDRCNNRSTLYPTHSSAFVNFPPLVPPS